jgi:hypothetical protein
MLAAQITPKSFGHHLPTTPHFHINIAKPKFKTTILIGCTLWRLEHFFPSEWLPIFRVVTQAFFFFSFSLWTQP